MAQTQLVEKFRQEKLDEESLRNQIRDQYLYDCPKSSEEKTAAEVFKRIADYKLKLKQGEVANMKTGDETFKPQLSKGHMRRYQTTRLHDGVWQLNELSQKHSWSCCMNENIESEGCVSKVRDLDRWITISL
jgi:hypothetical protein